MRYAPILAGMIFCTCYTMREAAPFVRSEKQESTQPRGRLSIVFDCGNVEDCRQYRASVLQEIQQAHLFASFVMKAKSSDEKEKHHIDIQITRSPVNIWTVIGTTVASILTFFILPIISEDVVVLTADYFENNILVSHWELSQSTSTAMGWIPGIMFLVRAEPNAAGTRTGRAIGLRLVHSLSRIAVQN